MSTRTYNLQKCAGSGLATQNSGKPAPTRSCIHITCEVAPCVMDAQPKTDVTVNTRSYSDVAASRPPSPQEVKETTHLPAESPSLDEQAVC